MEGQEGFWSIPEISYFGNSCPRETVNILQDPGTDAQPRIGYLVNLPESDLPSAEAPAPPAKNPRPHIP